LRAKVVSANNLLGTSTFAELTGRPMQKLLFVIALVSAAGLCGCATKVESRLSAPSICYGLQRFMEAAPKDEARSVLLFWPEQSANNDGDVEIPFYAAMEAAPMDAPAKDFYAAYGRATHYFELEDLGHRLQHCVGETPGFKRASAPDFYRDNHKDVRVAVSSAACGDRASRQSCIAITVSPR
jgi:hypothetical protein